MKKVSWKWIEERRVNNNMKCVLVHKTYVEGRMEGDIVACVTTVMKDSAGQCVVSLPNLFSVGTKEKMNQHWLKGTEQGQNWGGYIRNKRGVTGDKNSDENWVDYQQRAINTSYYIAIPPKENHKWKKYLDKTGEVLKLTLTFEWQEVVS